MLVLKYISKLDYNEYGWKVMEQGWIDGRYKCTTVHDN